MIPVLTVMIPVLTGLTTAAITIRLRQEPFKQILQEAAALLLLQVAAALL